ncbi:hypothetical protein OOU_Y34scaffold00461g4 [Pyricularia oryzae Y34]|uniref:Uncharacterized protein n=2 Tax=Pyricularia oryzae TaxID=318829 RepID=A0AA97P142_PYRO3|nr:hypothetical protein OOU_Y34scaffold00461g4 [Pyricularia oryzae Y34]
MPGTLWHGSTSQPENANIGDVPVGGAPPGLPRCRANKNPHVT